MVMPDIAPWTRERVLALPSDGNRYELIDGQLLVSPAARPVHQVACYGLAKLLDLVVEVLSPSTARYDRGLKRRFYQRAGVPQYWIVDLDARVMERWRPGDERPEVASETLAWQPAAGVAPLVIDLAGFFDEVGGLES
jgi:Uma2 family endonuclease